MELPCRVGLLSSEPSTKGQYEVIYPSSSIQAEPPVAVVDQIAEKHGTIKVAQAYLEYLYTDEGQEISRSITIGRAQPQSRRNTRAHFRS
ncbi:MAG TPA: hypothetical protein VKV03_09440 [Candidatus Binataceae bacterium]|nr:hypothetical protein [Candidatus Binataceae bacterium]